MVWKTTGSNAKITSGSHRVSGKGYMQGVKDACDFKVRRVTVNANRETRRNKL